MGCVLSKKHLLADCYVIRTSELGMHENFIHCKTHLGHLLNEGDSVLGLDVVNSNVNNDEMDSIKFEYDVILVKKVYDKQRRKRTRKWKLKRMGGDDVQSVTTEGNDEGYNRFMEDLEEDEETG